LKQEGGQHGKCVAAKAMDKKKLHFALRPGCVKKEIPMFQSMGRTVLLLKTRKEEREYSLK